MARAMPFFRAFSDGTEAAAVNMKRAWRKFCLR